MTTTDDARPILLNNAMLLDAAEGKIAGKRSVLVEKGRIKAVSDAPIAAEGAATVDLGGLTLMPGLSDAHVHVTAITADFAALKETPPASRTVVKPRRTVSSISLPARCAT
jgi:imidazolonepropionase-like amidohydrolase